MCRDAARSRHSRCSPLTRCPLGAWSQVCYSLACTGFELLCGAPPFDPDQGPTLMYAQIYADPPAASARRAGLPPAVDSVLATALAKDPADRYPSCGRFAEELRAALGIRPGERSSPARPRRAPAVAGQRLAVTGQRLAVTGQGPAADGQGPAADGQGPAMAGDGPPGVGARPALVEERPAAAPVPLGGGAAGEPDGTGPGIGPVRGIIAGGPLAIAVAG